jgi:hypothetical protein
LRRSDRLWPIHWKTFTIGPKREIEEKLFHILRTAGNPPFQMNYPDVMLFWLTLMLFWLSSIQ